MIVQLTCATTHQGLIIIRSWPDQTVLAQSASASAHRLLGHRQVAYYRAWYDPEGGLHLGEELPAEELPAKDDPSTSE